MFASGIDFFDVNEHGTGIDKVKVDSYMPTSQNDSSGFHTKKNSWVIFYYYFLLISNAKHKLKAIYANATDIGRKERGVPSKLINLKLYSKEKM